MILEIIGKVRHCKCDSCYIPFVRSGRIRRNNYGQFCDGCNRKNARAAKTEESFRKTAEGSRKFYQSNIGKEFAEERGKKRSRVLNTDEGLAKFLVNRPRGEQHHMFREDLPEFQKYRAEVTSYARRFKTEISLMENYDKRGMNGVEGAYQLDHKVSVRFGFNNNIPTEIIGHIANLHFIPWKENLLKKDACSTTINTLMTNIQTLYGIS
jgi:hypothetical protein